MTSNLCDISHADAINLVEDKSVINFLKKSKEPVSRRKKIAEKPSGQRKNLARIKRVKFDSINDFNVNDSAIDSDTNISDKNDSFDNDSDCGLSNYFKKTLNIGDQKINKVSYINDPKVVATLDRCKVSNAKAATVSSAFLSVSNKKLANLTVSKSSFQRTRAKVRTEISEQIDKKDFKAYTVHWDGKLMHDLDSNSKVDRLPVLVTNETEEKLLHIFKLKDGTGSTMSKSIYFALCGHKLDKQVLGMCYDTTASNTGVKKGACVLLENLLGRDLLNLSCRKHIFEILLEAEFNGHFQETKTSPDIPFF